MIEGLDAMLAGQDQPGVSGLRQSVNELISKRYRSGRLILQVRIKPRVFRLHFELEDEVLVLILKCMEGRVARRNELVARRWLPAGGLAQVGPPLLTTVGTPDGESVWHIYSDLGPYSLEEDMDSSQRVEAAVRLIAEIHKQFKGHPYMAEFRLFGGDLGTHFVESNLRDAIIILETITKDHASDKSDWGVVGRLLERVYTVKDELPLRLKMMKELAGPETLLHGDLWPSNVFVLPDGQARLIDWDHVAAGPAAYDLSTFILRFPQTRRFELIDLYQEAAHRTGWEIPAYEDLNIIFETCEYARYACQIIWPAIALWESGASWALEELEEVERWFQTWEAVLPNL
jgi:thiamine kinase-like enzyme